MYHPRLKGSHYEMGKHYGELLYKTGIDMTSVIRISDKQKEFCNICLPIYEKYATDIMKEVRGLADGLKINYEDLAFWLISLYCFESDHGCSIFAINTNKGIIFARNMDMFPKYKKTSESILYMPENKNKFIAHSTAMILLEDGMNEHGLACGLTFLLPKKIKPGINGGFIIRLILEECKTTKEAIELIQTLPISSTHNIVIADKSGDMATIEICSEQIKVRRNNKYVIGTNHFIEKEMLKYNNEEENWYKTCDRYKSIENALSNNNINFDSAKDILKGKYGFVCQYDKNMHFDTIWSAIYNLNTLYNEIAEGNPSKVEFKYDNRLAWGMKK